MQRYRGKKKSSCYKTQFIFHMRTIKQRHRLKYIYDTKTLTYTFHYWGAFCQGASVWGGGFCPRPVLLYYVKKFICYLSIKYV